MPTSPTNSATPEPSGVRRRALLGAAAAAPVLAGLHGTASAAPSAGRKKPRRLEAGGDLGPNVIVFDPSTPDIQARLDEIFRQQESAQFGPGRYQLLFKPGTYNGLNAQIGFYTSISGLGLSPDDTTINGDVTVDAGWFEGNATQNFWRSAENLALVPVNGTNRWAVAQAAPFRRMHVRGGLNLAPDGYGWASGGYIADSRVDGTVGPYSQQQWYTRDSSVGGWTNGVWNMVFSGVDGAPAQGFPNPPYTTLQTTPVSREKPFLYLDGDQYHVFLPALRTDSRGVTWGSGTPRGTSLPLDRFYVAKPGDSAATLNQALEQGLNLLLTPGIYHVDQPVEVNRPDTVVLGLGYATLIPDNGVTALRVADVDGVRLAAFLIDAGPVNSPVLLEVGPEGAAKDHSANPVTVQDVFIRIGGAGPGKATTSMVINARHTIVDHTWVWRADHGDGVGWETNRCDLRRRRQRRRRPRHRPVRRALQQVRRAVERRAGPHDLLPEREGVRRPRPGGHPERLDQGLRRLQGRRPRHHPRGLGHGQLLLLQRQPEHRAAPRLRRSRAGRGALPQPVGGVAERQRAVRVRHQRHRVAHVGHRHRAVHGGVLPLSPVPRARRAGAGGRTCPRGAGGGPSRPSAGGAAVVHRAETSAAAGA
ncbi:hypothetical protein RKD26_000775 [Streptomyces calvus]